MGLLLYLVMWDIFQTWRLAKVPSFWWKGREGLPNYMSCTVLRSQVMQLLLPLLSKVMMLLDFSIYILSIWVRMWWLNWEGEDFLMDRIIVNWSCVSTVFLESRRESDSRNAFITRRKHLIAYKSNIWRTSRVHSIEDAYYILNIIDDFFKKVRSFFL